MGPRAGMHVGQDQPQFGTIRAVCSAPLLFNGRVRCTGRCVDEGLDAV